jgi:hypothetical protein
MERNWGKGPWRCGELSPVDEKLESDLITTWNLVPDPQAFHGVASGGHIFCRYEDLSESYSGTSDSYRAVGIKDGKTVVYFYSG